MSAYLQWMKRHAGWTCHQTLQSILLKPFCSIKTTGHEKNHFTVVLTAKSDGVKLKPFVVFKSKGACILKGLSQIQGIVVRFSQNGWMNDSLTIDYLKSIIGALSFDKCLLIWDAYRCPTSEAVRGEIARQRLHTAVIPGDAQTTFQRPMLYGMRLLKVICGCSMIHG